MLFVPLLVFGQSAKTKPRTIIAPSGSWATNLVRAYAFSRLDSIAGDSLKDWSSNNVWGKSTDGTGWTNEGIESPGRNINITQARVFGCGALNTIGITDQLTVVQRIKLTTSGTVNESLSLRDRLDTPAESFIVEDIDEDADASNFCINNGSLACASVGDCGAHNNYVTILATYAGDSIRVWLNGTKKAATVKTGNIITDANYILAVGGGVSGAFDSHFAGTILMTCVWKRVITQTEINQITTDPYVMFRAPTGKRGQVILIGSTQSAKMFTSLFTIALAIGWINRRFQIKN